MECMSLPSPFSLLWANTCDGTWKSTVCETKTAVGATAQSKSSENKLESGKGRYFCREMYREESSRRPIFLTLKFYPTGDAQVKVKGVKIQTSWWRGVKVRMSLLLCSQCSSLDPASGDTEKKEVTVGYLGPFCLQWEEIVFGFN